MNRLIIPLLFLTLLFCKCKSNHSSTNNNAPEAPQKGEVVVIIDKYRQSTYGIPMLSYFDGYFINSVYIKNVKETDTIEVTTYLPLMEISYHHENGFRYSFMASPTDTLRIKFENNLPYAISNHKNQKPLDFSWQLRFESQHSLLGNKDPFYIKIKEKDLMKKRAYFADYVKELENKGNYINSLYQQQLISASNYSQIKRSLYYSKEDIFTDRYNRDYLMLKENFEFNKADTNANSTLGIMSHLSCKYKFGKDYNPRERFDSLFTDTVVKGNPKIAVLCNLLADITEMNPTAEFEECAAKLYSITSDTIYHSYIKSITPAEVQYKVTENGNDLWFVDTKGNKSNLTNLLSSNKGKVIYIDFWASWCAPCRAAMSMAKELRKEYANKDVVFVYLALSDKEEAWKKALPALGLESIANSYLIINTEKASIIKDLAITSIPHYLLIDRNGTIVTQKAPGPEGSSIRSFINQLL
ncbi:MAG: TlpA family protein disulfide reductase [Bacteroidales bacterium]|nr:TlpA family protein disulfide reductase [Bacteroidales bacterium]